MWAENDVGDNDTSGTDSVGILEKSKTAGKKTTGGGGTTTSSEGEDEHPQRKASKKPQSPRDKRRKRTRDPEDISTSDGGSDRESVAKRRKRKKTHNGRKSKRVSLSEIDSSPSLSSHSEEDSKPAPPHSNQRRSIESQPKRRACRRPPSPLTSLDDKALGSAYLYRTVRQERVTLGWSEAPCGSCPVFDFCKEGGPVGPSGCEYYGEWLKKAAVTRD